MFVELATQILIYVSAIFMLIGAIGLLRFPDVYNRTHAATMITVGGACMFLLVLAAANFWSIYTLKILIVVVFMMVTSPTISHAIANTAYKLDVKPKKLVRNELSGRVLERLKSKEEEL